MITKCTCRHKKQDELHGVGNRVFNPKLKKPQRPQEYECTVCGRIAQVGSSDAEKK